MNISTTRFGELQVNTEDVINFKEGILGFEKLTRFFIIDPGDNTLIMWLQSLDDGSIAFPIIEPKVFHSEYVVKLLPSELASLNLDNLSQAKVFSILTIPQDVTQMSANLKAPIVINAQTNTARQIVLQDNKLSVRYEMYTELKKHIITMANNCSDDSVRVNRNEAKPRTEDAPKKKNISERRRPEAQ